jgi:hypothetical protein
MLGRWVTALNAFVWLQQGNMRNWRAQRFRGTSDAFLSFRKA